MEPHRAAVLAVPNAIHHSTTHLDWVSGFRGHPFDGAFAAPVFAFFLAAGFDYRITGGLAIVQFVIGIWAHLNVRWRLRPLQKLILTPDFHHWHHAYDADGPTTRTSGIFLPVWDLVFGTYHMPADRRPMRYGIAQPTPPGNRRPAVVSPGARAETSVRNWHAGASVCPGT